MHKLLIGLAMVRAQEADTAPAPTGRFPAALGATDAELARLARHRPADGAQARWNAVVAFYGGIAASN